MSDTVLKVGETSFDLSPTIPLGKQKWRKHLILVSSISNRFAGLVEEIPENNRPFTLHHAIEYASQYRFEVAGEPSVPGGPPPLRATAFPQFLLPWDCLDPITMRITSHNWVLHIKSQSMKIQDYFFAGYQHCFAPSKIVLPQKPQIITEADAKRPPAGLPDLLLK